MSTAPARTVAEPYDEAHDAAGTARAHYAELLAWLEATDLVELRARVDRRVDAAGITFTTGDGDERWALDPVPRLFTATEWETLAAGLEQRVRALNAFVADVYGAQRIVEAGVVPASTIGGADGYLPELRGEWPGGRDPIGVAGLDVVREEDGTLTVLEDNVRTPSGYAYAAAAREILEAELAGCPVTPRPVRAALGELLGATLRAAAPDGVDDPCIVILTDGPDSSAWFEHATAAEALAVPLVTLDDLRHRDGRLIARTDDGERAVDVVYRRCDEDRLRDETGALTAVGAALGPSWRDGTVAIVNAFGTGVADDKLVHAYVEEMIGFYLGEEPGIASVATIDLGRPEACMRVLDDLRSYVVKPRSGFGGHGVVVGAHAESSDLDALAEAVRADPTAFIAQRTVSLSRHPTLMPNGRLAPRHIDLRPFVFSAGGVARALPGGLTRVALDEGALVVNSSQNGGGKDTWVLP